MAVRPGRGGIVAGRLTDRYVRVMTLNTKNGLADAAQIVRTVRDEHTFVLMGDFNATWDHASFRYLLGDRFVDSGENAGEWFHMTYPSNKRLFGVIPVPAAVEIDHIVHDRGVVVGDLDTVTIAGSDHKALLGTLEVR